MEIDILSSQEENKYDDTENKCPSCGRELTIKGNKHKCDFCNICVSCD